ncbi:MAG: hypothetical protein IJR85_07725 [Synergistaceae bacterium]|nr:hypothetical protein [Synergistaceae bacterium]
MESGYHYDSRTILVPADRSSEEDYGGNGGFEVVNNLSLLNGTQWEVTRAEAYRIKNNVWRRLTFQQLEYNTNPPKITLVTDKDMFMWVDTSGTYHYDPLTAVFVDEKGDDEWGEDWGMEYSLPLVRPASGFKELTSKSEYTASLGSGDDEQITIYGTYPSFAELTIQNTLQYNGATYISSVTLERR